MFNVNINKNNTLEELQLLVENNIEKKLSYMPDSFNEEQYQALELFKKRIFLEKTIEESVSFNRKINFPDTEDNTYLVKTVEQLVEVYKLRSDVYTMIDYQDEFPDTIEGLNFDKYDSNAAILFYKSDDRITGTTRLIFDSTNKLPSEEKFSFDHKREMYNTIVELSRLVVLNQKKGLSLEFKNLTKGVYSLFLENNIELILSAIKQEHFKLYSRFGGFNIEQTLDSYGNLDIPFLITSWNPAEVSSFFKKAFLS